MEFEGRLIQVLPEEGGVSQRGSNWRKKSWVFETFGQYPRKVCANVLNDRIDGFSNLEVGKTYVVNIDIESREFNGRWYTDVRMYNAHEPAGNASAGMAPQNFGGGMPQAGAPAAPVDPFQAGGAAPAAFPGGAANGAAGSTAFGDSNDDLPF